MTLERLAAGRLGVSLRLAEATLRRESGAKVLAVMKSRRGYPGAPLSNAIEVHAHLEISPFDHVIVYDSQSLDGAIL